MNEARPPIKPPTHDIQVEVSHYFPCDKGSLIGKFTMIIYPFGFTFYDCKYFETPTGKKFFTFPDKMVKKNPEDKPDYFPLVRIVDKAYMNDLTNAVVRAIQSLKPSRNKSAYTGVHQNVQAPKQAQSHITEDDAFDLPF